MSNDYDPNTAPAEPQERQPPLNRRFDFGSYAETRQFLDQLADLSKREDYYPNVSFGKNYANISIDGEGQVALSERKSTFITEMEALAAAGKA
jgi:4a-hydroxytetrahydrobiopterin dehydratase